MGIVGPFMPAPSLQFINAQSNSDVQPGVHVQDAGAARQGADRRITEGKPWDSYGRGGGTWEGQIESRKVYLLCIPIYWSPIPSDFTGSSLVDLEKA